MKSLKEQLLEALDLRYAKYYTEFNKDKSVRVLEVQKYFYDKVLELHKDAFLSRNGYRLYLPYTLDSKQETSKDEQISKIEQDVLSTLQNNGYYIKDKDDYIKNKCYKKIVTQRGEKEVQYNIAKVLKDKELKDAFASDPNRNRSKNDNKCYLCFSSHGYDIAGMSTDRGWTSCMNIIDGCNKGYVERDITVGTIICYLINEDDKNINKPLCRVLIKPRKLNGERTNIVYYPETSVYGIQGYLAASLIRYLEELCNNIYFDKSGRLINFDDLYNDTYNNLKIPNKFLNKNKTLPKEVLDFGQDIKRATAKGKVVICNFLKEGKNQFWQDEEYIKVIDYDDYIDVCKNNEILAINKINFDSFMFYYDVNSTFKKYFDKIEYKPDDVDVYSLDGPDVWNYSEKDEEYYDESYFQSHRTVMIINDNNIKDKIK